MSYLTSSYFKEVTGTDNVGVFYLISYLISLVILLNAHRIVGKIGRVNFFSLIVFLVIVSLAFLIVLPLGKSGMVFLVLYLIVSALSWVAMDIILETVSRDSLSGTIRGIHLTIWNTGWLVAPFIATRLLDSYGFHGIFLAGLLVFLAILIGGIFAFRKDIAGDLRKRGPIKNLLKIIFRKKDVMRAYWIAFILDFFFALMVVFMPIHLREIGFSWGDIGIIFSIMLIPFVILQYPAGVLADKKFGEKEMLIFSIALMGVSTIFLFFITGKSVLVWGFALFATRVGAALIEVLRDSYFFKCIDGCDVDIINFFRTSIPAGYIAGAVFSAIILLFFPLEVVFILLGIIILSGLYPALRLKDTR